MLLRLLLTARVCAGLAPNHRATPRVSPLSGKPRLLGDADADEAIDIQYCQAGTALLANEWTAVAETIGIAELSELAEARPSEIHGTGLFATQDLTKGTLVTLYRPDLTVDDIGNAFMLDEADAEHFQASPEAPGSRQYFVWPRGVGTSAVPADCPRFWVAANPTKEAAPGFLAHLANDGAACTGQDDIERYLVDSAELANACLLPLCIPVMGLVLSKDVRQDDELLVTYGYDAWLRTPLAATHPATVEALLRTGASTYAGLTVVASERYGGALKRLATFVRTGSTEEAPPPRVKRKKARGFG